MVVTELPDVFGAVLLKLRATTPVTDLTLDRIADEVKESWSFAAKKAKYAVVVQGPFGSPLRPDPPHCAERYDTWSYGPDARTALVLSRRVRAALTPIDGGRNGFTFGGVRVEEVAQEGGPTRLIDPDTRWWYVVDSFVLTYIGVPVS